MSDRDKTKLTRRQLEVLDALFDEGTTEEGVLSNHNVSWNVYRKWLSDENFVDEFDFRMQSARRQGELVIAKYASIAAMKLVGLMNSDKGETVRKACLDIMSMPMSKPQNITENNESEKPRQTTLSSEVAGKLLSVLSGDGS